MAYIAAERTTELGIRVALGAQRGGMLQLILRQSFTLVGVGIAAGVLAAFAGTRLLATLLYGGVVLLLLLAGFIVTLVPARCAMSFDLISHSDMSRRGWLAIAALLFVCGDTAIGKQALEKIERAEYPVASNAAVSLRLGDGTVHVYASEENVVALTAIKKSYTKERLDEIKVAVNATANAVAIETTFPPKPTGFSTADRSGTVDYILLVPQTCLIAGIEVENGEVIVEGMRGEGLNVRLTNGRILARNCFTETKLTLGRGGIDLGFGWWESDRSFAVSAQSTNGDIHIALPEDATARFEATTSNGWIRNTFEKDGAEKDSHSQQWTMGEDPRCTFRLNAQSGNLRIDKIY